MDREEVQICDICGDAGYADELTICDQCNDSVEHIYCMTTKLEHVPLYWTCERCELEKKNVAKKRLLGIETIPVKEDQKSSKANLYSIAEEKKAKSMGSILKESSQSSLSVPPKDSKQSNNLTVKSPTSQILPKKGDSVVEKYACSKTTSTLNQQKVSNAAKLYFNMGKSGDVPGQPSSKLSTACHVSSKADLNVKGKDEASLCRSSADKPFSGAKHGFSKSSSFPARDDDRPGFLLPARQKEYMRSKSALAHPFATSRSASSIKNSKIDLRQHEHTKISAHGTHRHAVQASTPLERSKSPLASEPEHIKPVMQDASGLPVREASKLVESSRSTSMIGSTANDTAGEHKNKQLERGSRYAEMLQFNCRGANFPKEADFQTFKGNEKCFKCNKEGHAAAQCSYLGNGGGRALEEKKALPSLDNSMARSSSIPKTDLAISPKERAQWKWKDCSVTSNLALDQTQMCSKERPSILGAAPSIRGVGPSILGVAPAEKKTPASFDKSMARSGSIPKTDLILDQTQICSKEGLSMLGTKNMAHRCSPKLCEGQQLHEQHADLQAQNTKGSIGAHGLVQGQADSIQGGAALKQADGANAMKEYKLPLCSNSISCSDPCNRGDICELASTEDVGLALETSIKPVEPSAQILWSGCFCVSNTLLVYKGMQAHASTKADPRVAEVVRSLPFELHLEELKRGVKTDTWPSPLQHRPPTSSSIGVYFFPADMECHDVWYKPLLDHLVANDLALKMSKDFFQLLIFPSHLLSEADQCWDDRHYLWGIFKNAN